MNVREKFHTANIPYDDIDKEMIELIDILNFDLDLKTEFCCYGHKNGEEAYIVFDNSITDEQVYILAKYLSQSKRETSANGIYLDNNFGEFNKWVRNEEDGLAVNWTYTFPNIFSDKDLSLYENIKKSHMSRIVEDLKEYKTILVK